MRVILGDLVLNWVIGLFSRKFQKALDKVYIVKAGYNCQTGVCYFPKCLIGKRMKIVLMKNEVPKKKE